MPHVKPARPARCIVSLFFLLIMVILPPPSSVPSLFASVSLPVLRCLSTLSLPLTSSCPSPFRACILPPFPLPPCILCALSISRPFSPPSFSPNFSSLFLRLLGSRGQRRAALVHLHTCTAIVRSAYRGVEARCPGPTGGGISQRDTSCWLDTLTINCFHCLVGVDSSFHFNTLITVV
ncbi:hypothetical protein DFH06DRAFT_144010 [Mycena polygramma]|nr:hypothetical protein DFH06DRAFT_144010 [Mycena polygramma]